MSDILLVSGRGLVARFHADEIRPLELGSAGLAGMMLRAGDAVVAGMDVGEYDPQGFSFEDLVVVTSMGTVCRIPLDDIPPKSRATMGVQAVTMKSEDDTVVGAFVTEASDE